MTTQTMKAVRVTAYHAPMEMHDIAIPTVQAPLDVIVRVGAAGESIDDTHVKSCS
jgi:NAD+-dependent secondary alcohol dehydrogenase Adh1